MIKHYHLIGVGGIGMSGIAKLLLRRNFKVSGSDLKDGKSLDELRKLGASIFIGHNAKNVLGADTVIYSSAIKSDNPEIAEAKARGILILMRACALAELMRGKTSITVSGSHGKTTTSSLISYLLLKAGLLPTIAVGGILRNIDTNAYAGDGEFFVAEADESDGSFLYYHPRYSVVTNIDYEHLDYYHDFENILKHFKDFLNKTQVNGCTFCCGDDANLRNILKEYKGRRILFGLKEDNDIYAKNIALKGLTSEFDCFYRGKLLGRFFLALGGEHNISNALSVIALGLELNLSQEIIKNTLATYQGTQRRLEIKYTDQDLLVISDYAHHPTEIKASLLAVRNLARKRLIVVFQPHRYTRTKILLEEFAKSFDAADYVVITDIYAAGEQPIGGVNGKALCDKVKENFLDKPVVFLAKEKIKSHILEITKSGDLVIFLGAGDIVKICDELVQEYKGQSQAARAA